MLLRLAFRIAKDTGQHLHDVLALPISELNLWWGFYLLEAEELEYSRKHKGKARPVGYGEVGFDKMREVARVLNEKEKQNGDS